MFYQFKRFLILYTIVAALLLQLRPAAAFAQSSIITPKVAAAPGVDPDADIFAAACGALSGSQLLAVSNFVKATKAAGVWSKVFALYPFVGGTPACHSLNLKNPIDSDAAYRLAYMGTTVHGATGATFASGSAANTFYIQSVAGTGFNISFGYWSAGYSGNNMGTVGGADGNARNTFTTSNGSFSGAFSGNNMSGVLGSSGFVLVSHPSAANSGSMFAYENGVQIATNGSFVGTPTTGVFVIHGFTNAGVFPTNVAGNGFAETIKFAYIAAGLSGAEVTALYNAAAALQTALGR